MRITSAGKHIMRVAKGKRQWVTYYVRHHSTGKWRYFGAERPWGMRYLKARGFSESQVNQILAYLPRFEAEKRFIGSTDLGKFMQAVPRYAKGGLQR